MADPIPFPKSPLPPLGLIEEGQVCTDRLKQVLDAAFIDCEVEPEGDLYISDGLDFPIWISLDRDRKLINAYTCIGIRMPAGDQDFKQVNELNKKLIVVKFHVHDGALWGNTWFTYDSGISARQFVTSLRRFAKIFQQATNEPCMAALFHPEPEQQSPK